MADLDPFAAAGFAPAPNQGVVDPFTMAGFVPEAAKPEQPTQPLSSFMPRAFPNPGSPFPTMLFPTAQQNKEFGQGQIRALEKAGEGATFGMMPYGIAGARMLGGVPFSQGLQEARDYTAQTAKENPVASGLLEGLGGFAPTGAAFRVAGPLISSAGDAVRGGSAMARALLSGTLGGGNAAGHDIGAGTTETLGSDTAKGTALGAALSGGADLLGAGLQAIPNAARSLYAGARNVFSDQGRQGVVGQVLREAGGEFPNQAARTAIPGLTLRVPQATGNPGLASLESMLASEPGIQRGDLGTVVQNNRTPDQASALARALVGPNAGIEPAILTNQASARGVQAIQGLDESLHGVERSLWNAPALQNVRLNGPGIAVGVGEDVSGFPASWRDAVTGPQNKLGAFLTELHELGPDASIPDINSVRSRLLGVARGAAAGPQPDAVTAAAANRMAGHILDRMGADPAITGTPATTRAAVTELHSIPGEEGPPVPVQIGEANAPETPPNPAPMRAFQQARDFTRQFNQAKGFNEFDSILHPNAQGNMQGNAEKQFGQFFDMTGGTGSGLERLQGLVNFARGAGQHAAADELENAGRDYFNSAILKQSRAGTGLTATGEPSLNLASMASTINKAAPSLNATAMTAPIAGDVQAVGNAAELVNRPSTMRGSTNSTTYERLKQNDLVNAVLGQSATSGLGALGGGYAGYQYGPESVPWYLRVPGGAMAGALMANTAGPAIGNIVSHTPILRGLGAGPSENIRRQVMEALSNMPAYERAVATPMLSGPALTQPGMVSNATRMLGRGALVPTTSGGAR